MALVWAWKDGEIFRWMKLLIINVFQVKEDESHTPAMWYVLFLLPGQGYGLTNITYSMTPLAMKFNGYWRGIKENSHWELSRKNWPFYHFRVSMTVDYFWWQRWPWITSDNERYKRPLHDSPWNNGGIWPVILVQCQDLNSHRYWFCTKIAVKPGHFECPNPLSTIAVFWMIDCACVYKSNLLTENPALEEHGIVLLEYHIRDRHFLLPPPTTYTFHHMLWGVIARTAPECKIMAIRSLNELSYTSKLVNDKVLAMQTWLHLILPFSLTNEEIVSKVK